MNKRLALAGLLGLLIVGPPAATAAPAAPRVAPISAHCSLATATAVMKALPQLFNDPPTTQVLCGSFTGPHSNAMVASVSTPGCGFSIGWIVFRRDGDAWVKVFESQRGAFLDKLGTKFRETWSLLRNGDPHCLPTGGTKSRIWHWNGTRLARGAFVRTGAMFFSPSRNVSCTIAIGSVRCASKTPPHAARLTTRGAVTTCTGTRCLTVPTAFPNAAVLRYGHSVAAGPFRCTSRQNGVTCVVIRTGKGFRINKAGVTRV